MGNMKKLFFLFTSILMILSPAFSAEINLDKEIYEIGDTMDVTISDCPDGTAVTANIPRTWSAQGVSSGNSWSTSYLIPASFDTGEDFNLNGYCGEELSTTFCVNPDCQIAATSEGGGSSGGSSSSSSSSESSSSSGGGAIPPSRQPTTSNEEPESKQEPEAEQESESESEEESSAMMYIIAALILISIIAGGFYFYKKKKAAQSGTGYVNYSQMNRPTNNQSLNNNNNNNNNQY